MVAKHGFMHVAQPAQKLTLEWLTQWLAQKAGMAYFHLDPLKVNVAKVADVMSYKFAERHHILAVQVGKEELVITTDQPFYTDWLGQLEQTARGKEIRVVVSNPEDLNRYRLEFYNLSRSIQRATGNEGPVRCRHRQLRATAGNGQGGIAGCQRPAHRCHR
jgi:general secretion pathway protein E